MNISLLNCCRRKMPADSLTGWKRVSLVWKKCQNATRGTKKSHGLRIFPIDNYVVCYIADTEKRIVTVIRVMYGRRDIEHQRNVRTKQLQ